MRYGLYEPDIDIKDVYNEQGDLWLMMKDTPVMQFNLCTGAFKVVDTLHLPYQLKYTEGVQKGNSDACTRLEFRDASYAIDTFLGSRVLILDRANAKVLYNALGFPQVQDVVSKRNIALSCRATSLQDNYWVKRANEPNLKWADVNLRTNSLNDVITQIALHGKNLTLQGKACTPELTTQGTYAKAWKREQGSLYLYKKSTANGMESQAEVCVSELLDKLQIPHIAYFQGDSQGEYCCKCECMTSDKYSILPALDLSGYCERQHINFTMEMFKYEPTLIYQMFIVDYLFSNSDRHFNNWGFYYDCDTMQITGCHSLFDHNSAFNRELLFDDSLTIVNKNMVNNCCQAMPGVSMLGAAQLGVKKLDFELKGHITAKDFLLPEHYESFKFKAQQLGIWKQGILNLFRK